MADGGARLRIDIRDESARRRRIVRTIALPVLVAVAGLLAWGSPRGLAGLHVGINAVAGLVWLGIAVWTRKSPERIRGIPVWLESLVLAACLATLAVPEARQKLG